MRSVSIEQRLADGDQCSVTFTLSEGVFPDSLLDEAKKFRGVSAHFHRDGKSKLMIFHSGAIRHDPAAYVIGTIRRTMKDVKITTQDWSLAHFYLKTLKIEYTR